MLYIKDCAGIDPRKFVKSTPNDGLAAGLGHAIFKSSSGFYALVFNIWSLNEGGEIERHVIISFRELE